MERFIQVKLLAKLLQHLFGELWIERINLTGLSRRQMYDGEGNHRDEEKGNRFLHQAPSKKSKHLLALRLKGWHIWQFDPFVEKKGIIAGFGWPYLFILYFTRGIPLHADYAFVQ